MGNLNVYRISFMNGTVYSNVIVLSESYEEAEELLKQTVMIRGMRNKKFILSKLNN